MELSQALIDEYAKKIFGFAFSKLHDFHKAEDLSQEILTQLFANSTQEKDIQNMNAFIYRVCQYTWAKYLRGNKRHWQAMGDMSVFEHLQSEDNTEQTLINKETIKQLRQEIAYLSRQRREILIAYYYDNLSSDQIAAALCVPASTVRWHLHKTRLDLKERMEMEKTNAIYNPVRLCVGHNGWVSSMDMNGLCSDLLMQNICWLCRKPQTVEALAQTMNVAAVYLEDKIEKLLYMDYLKSTGSKLQTNFFIRDETYQMQHADYVFKHALPLAKSFLSVMTAALPEIRAVGFCSSDEPDSELIFNLMPLFLMHKIGQIDHRVAEKNHWQHKRPIRKDGTEHWVHAFLEFSLKPQQDPAFSEFMQKGGGSGPKTRGTGDLFSVQIDLNCFSGWREFNGEELEQLKRVYTIIKENQTPNDYDKGMIAQLAQLGYVRVENGRPQMLIPYLTAPQMEQVNAILDRYTDSMFDFDAAVAVFEGYAKQMKPLIPDSIDENERRHLITSFANAPDFLFLLLQNGLLPQPDAALQKRMCTVVYQTK